MTGGDGAPEPLPPPPGPPPTITPADPAAPSAPPHPGATRAGRHGRPPHPTALNDPSHHTRETHSDALATTLRTRRTRPSRPPPTTFTPHVFKTTPEQPSGNCTLRARIVIMARVGGRGVVRVGLLGRSGAGACPNLLQRRPATGSAARRSAEYQRSSSGAPARSGPLQQIWTNGAATAREGRRESGGGRGGRPDRPGGPAGVSAVVAIGPAATSSWAPPDAETCTSHSKVQFQPSFVMSQDMGDSSVSGHR